MEAKRLDRPAVNVVPQGNSAPAAKPQATNDKPAISMNSAPAASGAVASFEARPVRTRDVVSASLDNVEKVVDPRASKVSELDVPANSDQTKVSLYDKAVGLAAWPFLQVAYAVALSGRAWKTDSLKARDGEKSDQLSVIKNYFWSGLNPVVLAVRTAQTVCLPIAAVGKGLDYVISQMKKEPGNDRRTALDYRRSVFGYTATALDGIVARPVLSPLAGLGVVSDKIGPAMAQFFGTKPARDSGDRYYDKVGEGIGAALKTVFFPTFAVSRVWDFAAEKITGKPIDKMTYGDHAARGLARAAEGALYAPAAPVFGFGKVADAVGAKLSATLGLKKEIGIEAGEKDSLRKKYWAGVGSGVLHAVQLPFRIVALPTAALSGANGFIHKTLGFKYEEPRPRTFWYHGYIRGVGMGISAPFVVVGGIVSGIGTGVAKMFGKQLDPNKTLWGHPRTLGGLALDGADTVGHVVGSPLYALDAAYRWPGSGKDKDDKTTSKDFYERAGLGLIETVGLPVVLPGAVIGAGGAVFDSVTGRAAPEGREPSLLGYSADGMRRTWSGAVYVANKTIIPGYRAVVGAVARVFGR